MKPFWQQKTFAEMDQSEWESLCDGCARCCMIKLQDAEFGWLPTTCGYRTLAEGRDLQWWHPLVSGSPDTVHEAGISVRGKVIAESQVHEDDQQDMIIHWVEMSS